MFSYWTILLLTFWQTFIFLFFDTDELRILPVSTIWSKLIYLKLSTFLNIFSILVTLISKWDISRTFKLVQLENIESKLVTWLVLKLDKSKDSIELHPSNIELISTTEKVSKDNKSIEVNLLQP